MQKLYIKKGKELLRNELKTINYWRKKEFNSRSIIDPQPGNDDWNKIYILLKNGERILAFGRMHEVCIEFMHKNYDIYGLATLIALNKGKGYGAQVLKAQLDYAKSKGKTAIGFCNKKLTDYYRKNSLGVIIDGTKRFLYKDDDGNLHKDNWGGGDVIYVEGNDGLLSKIKLYPNEIVITYRQHW